MVRSFQLVVLLTVLILPLLNNHHTSTQDSLQSSTGIPAPTGVARGLPSAASSAYPFTFRFGGRSSFLAKQQTTFRS